MTIRACVLLLSIVVLDAQVFSFKNKLEAVKFRCMSIHIIWVVKYWQINENVLGYVKCTRLVINIRNLYLRNVETLHLNLITKSLKTKLFDTIWGFPNIIKKFIKSDNLKCYQLKSNQYCYQMVCLNSGTFNLIRENPKCWMLSPSEFFDFSEFYSSMSEWDLIGLNLNTIFWRCVWVVTGKNALHLARSHNRFSFELNVIMIILS